MNEVRVAKIRIGRGNPLVLIAGPCVIESEEITFTTANKLKEICDRLGISLIFKSSYDKANRTSGSSFRGPGIDKGLKILSDVKKKFSIPVISDVHSVDEVKPASEVLDALQIPGQIDRSAAGDQNSIFRQRTGGILGACRRGLVYGRHGDAPGAQNKQGGSGRITQTAKAACGRCGGTFAPGLSLPIGLTCLI